MHVSSLKNAIKQVLENITIFIFNAQAKKPAPQPVFLTIKRRS